MSLEPFADGVWVAHAPQKLLGWQLGTRMTVLRLADGSLLIHSPIELDQALKSEIEALGPVGHIVAPNLFHHLYVGGAASAFPDAKLHGARGLRKKRPDLRFDAVLGEQPEPSWRGSLETLEIKGSLLEETVFWHRPSRALVSADLIENFDGADDWWTRLYLKVGGIDGKIGLSRMLRLAYRNRKQARHDIDALLDWDFERIVLAHGDPIESGGAQALREAYHWLKA
ncbi:MAG: hypothetical protein AMS21_01380 [Gemmatimonas sp. SG8_38_2]|nr:MAG: hypothetical protein AMS21_01380 [Gemmatimonas sp. SG8_38_2]